MSASQTFPTRLTQRIVLTISCLLVPRGALRGEVIAPGDFVVTTAEAPLKSGTKTLAAIPAGWIFSVESVDGSWVLVEWRSPDARAISRGFLHRRYVVKQPQGMQLRYAPYRDVLSANSNYWWQLPRGESLLIDVRSSDAAVDVFLITDEGKAAYEWVLQHGSGQMSSLIRAINVQEKSISWRPPDSRQYFLLVDNSDFPDGGASGRKSTTVTVVKWQADPMPPDPIPGRGLLIGRVSIDYDGFEGKHQRHDGLLTVHIAHRAESEHDSKHQVITASVTKDGYFAAANLVPERRYWLAKVEGSNFEASIPLHASGPIRSQNQDAHDQSDVKDMGYFELSVNSHGKIGCVLHGPVVTATVEPGDGSTQFHFDSSSRLDRHAWFERAFPASPWTERVRSNRVHIEQERREKKSRTETAPAAP